MRPVLFFSTAWLLLLVACAPVGPEYRPPAANLPDNWSDGRRPATSAALHHSRRWWGMFADPILNGLVDRAIAANHDLRIATSRITAARARLRQTTAATAPSLDAGAGATHSRRSGNAGSDGGSRDLFEAGFDAAWELDLFGGRRRSIEAATATLAASEENRRDILVSLEAEVARTYFELRGSERLLATARNTLAAQEKTLAVVTGRRQLGLASDLDSAQAQTQKSLVAAQIPTLEQKITAGRNQLALLLDLQPAEMARRLAGAAPAFTLPSNLPPGLPSDLLRRRPDIRQAERLVAAATAEVGVATADLFPRFSLSGLIGLQSSSLSDLVSSGSRYWSIGPSLSLPVFNRGRLQAAVTITKAELEETEATYEKIVLAALLETENALVGYSREQETRARLAAAVETGSQALTFNEGLYAAGLADLTDVLASRRTLYAAQEQLIISDQRLAANVIALYKALGGGWHITEATQPTPPAPGISP
ncbi:efflux transporter outer membrane subunit [Desulfoprunum benzoelyticum]|uniref:NodT family efflux transporter outer membrane factor (OMF) lipoprotein n=1 Tax=Desulfoprunum benzoelyticum TaxID=1506996 RepID=A0A840V374_9BACT|nr:efflux transporter outer membrane subunit [Desulfoprunum benzoelyticum]MBB5349278.1 NodT family efflux transporter outer membrane factor (OMF) lipoprotein [Desulfoprunum benzoelyticum]MBM9530974.1 efflux transporter outer membrane subunit [Desulfoprunum benzoelyticum]